MQIPVVASVLPNDRKLGLKEAGGRKKLCAAIQHLTWPWVTSAEQMEKQGETGYEAVRVGGHVLMDSAICSFFGRFCGAKVPIWVLPDDPTEKRLQFGGRSKRLERREPAGKLGVGIRRVYLLVTWLAERLTMLGLAALLLGQQVVKRDQSTRHVSSAHFAANGLSVSAGRHGRWYWYRSGSSARYHNGVEAFLVRETASGGFASRTILSMVFRPRAKRFHSRDRSPPDTQTARLARIASTDPKHFPSSTSPERCTTV